MVFKCFIYRFVLMLDLSLQFVSGYKMLSMNRCTMVGGLFTSLIVFIQWTANLQNVLSKGGRL